MSDAPHKFDLHIGDYLRDTEDLSLLQHGVYLRLMLWYYSTAKPLPHDIERINRRVGATSKEERGAVEYVLTEFFQLRSGKWVHKRIEEELGRWSAITFQAREAAKKKWEKFRQNNEKQSADAVETQSVGKADADAGLQPSAFSLQPLGLANANPLSGSARRLLEFLNEKTKRNFRPTKANLKLIIARLREYSESELRAMIAMKCREWGDGEMAEYLRPKTLFSDQNCAQYMGKVGTFNEEA